VTALLERVTFADVPLPAGVAVMTPADTDLLPASKSSCRHVYVGSKPSEQCMTTCWALLRLAHRFARASLPCQHSCIACHAHLVNAPVQRAVACAACVKGGAVRALQGVPRCASHKLEC
jgi:hypothetical protein